MKLKYIKTIDNIIVVFPEVLAHDKFKYLNPVSAGFIQIHPNENFETGVEYTCYGESISLGLKSDETDSKIAQQCFTRMF